MVKVQQIKEQLGIVTEELQNIFVTALMMTGYDPEVEAVNEADVHSIQNNFGYCFYCEV